jgi:hypothetical protein
MNSAKICTEVENGLFPNYCKINECSMHVHAQWRDTGATRILSERMDNHDCTYISGAHVYLFSELSAWVWSCDLPMIDDLCHLLTDFSLIPVTSGFRHVKNSSVDNGHIGAKLTTESCSQVEISSSLEQKTPQTQRTVSSIISAVTMSTSAHLL